MTMKKKFTSRYGVAVIGAAAFVALWIVVLVAFVEAGLISPSFIAGAGRWLGAAGMIAVALAAWILDAEVRYHAVK